MKGTIFAVALNHRSQLDAWQEAFQQSPYKAPPKTAVWFIKPRNTVIGCGEPIPFPQGDAPRDKRTYFREINYIAAAFQYQKKNYNSA
ncbi:TPA: hypothetical protein JS319_002970 [Escherichia coli]|nr:hypothetical protein [Escherichia coli]